MSTKKKEEKATKKEIKRQVKKTKVKNVGMRKKRVALLWVLLLTSSGFGLYRNYSAIDTHTVYNETVIESRIQNTSGVENFVIQFAREFFEYNQNPEFLDERTVRLQEFMTDDLIQLNQHQVTNYIENESRVQGVFVWNVVQTDEHYLDVIFSVVQRIEGEADLDRVIESAYRVTVFVDEYDGMVITRKSFASIPNRAEYEHVGISNDSSVDSNTRHDVLEFLELFFGLYPNADAQELSFYVRDQVLPVIEREMTFNHLMNPVFAYVDDVLMVEVSVEYLCQTTLTNVIATYLLHLERVGDNFIIVGSY